MINEIEINSDRFAQVRNARNTEIAEDYTEMIADLIRETGEARAVDLAKHFGVTGPTVNSIIRRLVREGSEVAKIGKAFGMQVIAWSENLNLDTCKKLDVLPCSKEDLVKNSDFLSIHVQGGERYKNCITLKELDKMKKTSFLINTSRGPIVNEDDLIIALSTNEIAGAGLDVFEKEPLPENNKLRFLPNALLTPHLGYVTAENYSIYYTQMIESLEACVDGKPIRIIE